MSSELSDRKSDVCKPFAYTEELCKSCDRKYYTSYKGGKWFCFGVSTFESRKKQGIPELDNLRLCVKHPAKLPEPPITGLYPLNLSERDARELLKGLDRLLKVFV